MKKLSMNHLALLLSLIALIFTKVADIVTTVRGIRRAGSANWEQNPLARWAMIRFGVVGGIGFVMLLWALITAACYVPAWFASVWVQWSTAVGGGIISWCQWEVARFKATRRHSWFTRMTLRSYQRWQTLTSHK